eukprot:1286595-Rhodomonas_salina.1
MRLGGDDFLSMLGDPDIKCSGVGRSATLDICRTRSSKVCVVKPLSTIGEPEVDVGLLSAIGDDRCSSTCFGSGAWPTVPTVVGDIDADVLERVSYRFVVRTCLRLCAAARSN